MRIQPDEYEEMRSWLGHMAPKVFPPELLTPQTDPVAVLDQIASKSAADGRSGLGMAVGDIVEFTSAWSESEVAAVDAELSSKGLPTLTVVQARFSKVVRRAVRRGRIRDDDEFYAVRNAVDRPGAEQARLWPLLAAYEAQKASERIAPGAR